MKNIILLIICFVSTNIIIAQDKPLIYGAEFRVEGECGMCEERIEATALEAGAIVADWNADTKILAIDYEDGKVTVSAIRYAIAQAGHDNGNFLTPTEVYDALPGCCQYRPDKVASMISFRVEGNCGSCANRIQSTAIAAGAELASWDAETRMLTLDFDPEKVTLEKIKYSIAQLGHDNGGFVTPDEVYVKLPVCCQYRDIVYEDVEQDQNRSDEFVAGRIMSIGPDGDIPLIGANVTWLESGKGTITDLEGAFMIEQFNQDKNLVISYIGYKPDTILVENDKDLDIFLSDGVFLDEVKITYREKTSAISFVKTINSENISRNELRKAACCNLSESFDTNPSIDVSFADAVTGTRQIQMLGLAGPYVQITRELIPEIRVLASSYGLSFTPGAWIESIQLNKGAGSVSNGFESITGQINVELKKPESEEQFHFNAYANEGARLELNTNYTRQLSKNVSTTFLLHAKQMQHGNDRNNDGFTDMPLEKDIIISNRWKFYGKNGWEGQLGAKVTMLSHEGGVLKHFDGTSEDHANHWRYTLETERYDGWLKVGRVFPSMPYASVGFQLAGSIHKQDSEFGFKAYDAEHNSLYANLIYQSILFNDDHTFKTGITYQYDDVEETIFNGFHLRNESVPGAYFEYAYNDTKKWAVMPGIRVDHHSNYGLFVTPRLHVKYNFAEESLIRFSAGRGLRTASIFAENIGIFSSARNILIDSNIDGQPYGLDPEIAWNLGLNFTHNLRIGEKDLTIIADLYRTTFENQIVVDWDQDPQEVHFYNLEGRSYSNSAQIKLEYEVLPRFDVRVAYRLFDVKTDYEEGLLERPMVSRHRAFINLGYKTENEWAFDFTLNRQGGRRLPSTASNPEEFRLADRSPAYFLANGQVSKTWKNGFEVYLGGENIFNFRQENPIISADDPFGEYFDASIVWAPLFGRNIYIGMRYTM
jgi:outer membrane receptor for ferrienterochelin and colicin